MCAYLKFEQVNTYCGYIFDFTHCACVVLHNSNQAYVDLMHVGIVYILCDFKYVQENMFLCDDTCANLKFER
jgi:hypothetical protein